MKKFLVISIQIILLTSITITGVAQTRDEFKNKYGAPNSRNQYAVKSNIGVKVGYAQNRILSWMIIEPLDTNDIRETNPGMNGSKEVMSSLKPNRYLMNSSLLRIEGR